MPLTDNAVYGYVNGKPVFNRDEFIFTKRGFGAIENDNELLAYAKKVTHNWQNAGWNHSFLTFYLSEHALNEPCASLTKSEFIRLKELQVEAQEQQKRLEEEQEWRYIETCHYADNSVEEVWENKYGKRENRIVVWPHGD